ncbi:MAG: hypothetical protein GXO98_01515 [Nitrospirae bacterium]|nr:hypothetical protein [Nitrospirota bacterium]
MVYSDRHSRRRRLIWLFALTVFLLSSCSSRKAPEAEKKKFEIDKVTTRGPLTVHVRVSKSKISLADELDLELEASIKEGYRVEFPQFGKKLEQFRIRDYRNFPPKLSNDGRILFRKLYRLEPFLSGNYKIPAMTIKFYKEAVPAKKKEKGSEKEKKHQLETEEIPIKVTSLIGKERKNLSIRKAKDVVALPPSRKPLLYLALAAAIGGTAIVTLLILRQRRRHRKGEEPRLVSPHELAYEQLRRLDKEKLIENGQIKEFYIRISDILRHYIENRFGLRAPERTTEEFLLELAGSNELDKKQKELLQDFLQTCDLVKFAHYRPEIKEIQDTFDAARRFIKETAREEKTVTVAVA